jgi:hypothetical protein
MSKPQTIVFGSYTYYRADDLKTFLPIYFVGTSRTIRQIIEKKSIPAVDRLYATHSKKLGWTVVSDQLKPPSKATLFLSESWSNTNIPGLCADVPKNIVAVDDYPEAPPLLELEDSEKFHDSDGNIFEIETRGERTAKNIFFLAKDVSRVFDMPSLVKNITDKSSNSTYVIDTHYKIFYTEQIHTVENKQTKQIKKAVYLTYKGMLKTLFGSHSKRADYFTDWATDVLFTVQMGTEEQREELGAKVIGQPVRAVRAVFKTFVDATPCVYRFSLGTVATLRQSMNIPTTIKDNFIVIKYGRTRDIRERILKHIKTYEKIDGVALGLMNCVYVDPKYLSVAECEIKEFYCATETPIIFASFKELFAIDPSHEKIIIEQYKIIGHKYAGSLTGINQEIERMKTENILTAQKTEAYNILMAERHAHDLTKLRAELEKKDLIISNKELQIQLLTNR